MIFYREKKRHIGNDLVVVIFLDRGAEMPDFTSFRSEMNHVFVTVQVLKSKGEDIFYGVGVSRKPGVDFFGPPTPQLIVGGMSSEYKWREGVCACVWIVG